MTLSKLLIDPIDGTAQVNDLIRFNVVVGSPGPTDLTAFTVTDSFDAGYSNDAEVYGTVDKYIGPGYNWNLGPNISGGRLQFKSQLIDLNRVASAPTSPGSWK